MKKLSLLATFAITLLPILSHAETWAFDVYLDKSKMGQHAFTLTEKNGMQELVSKAKFNVKVLFVNAYSYDHTAKEIWIKDANKSCLSSIEAKTIENKVNTNLSGKLDGKNFVVNVGDKDKQSLAQCVSTFAYWNPEVVKQSELLNPQNGVFQKTYFENLGSENILVKGKPTDTTHYRLLSAPGSKIKLDIDLWYANNKDWVALKSVTPEGYTVHYKLK